ncbi:DNA ligase 4 [Paramyrothecium foliicola]|nr:DNA ligase 4 [Paramyrothecium foliicola]
MSILEEAAHEEHIQYEISGMSKEELDDKPRNHSKTLLFSDLFRDLFNPLNENKKQPSGGPARKKGPHGATKLSPQEQRRHIVERFITRWRKEVGNDFYPALRLILPDKDRDRGVYGLKENAIGKILVKLMKIDKNSEDGYNLLHWKLPGQSAASRLAGDFAGRCYEVISKRPMRTTVGDMTLAEVNEQLDKLAASVGEAENLQIFEIFYNRMNAEEMMWLIRIILKQMKVGATERTFLDLWHPDAEALFSVSSSLRRVCWELYNPEDRLEQEETGISLMQCFQPQLAQFQMPASFQKMIELLRPSEDDPEFWIEEKLDGERMQMHMIEDPAHPGGRRFCFWSRKAKDYTYLYGDGLQDENSALTRHLKNAFASGVRNIILDGEMITWDMGVDKIVPFGTLKTAALAEQQNKSNSDAAGHRPLFRVFDILYLNNKQLTQYTLRDRHNALEKAVKSVHRRLEIHNHTKATTADAIEPLLRDVVANASEGLVLKNPRSMYRLNSRNDDWLKVKPEYMSEFGESLDCVIIGGYYGSGRRGGFLSSYLCGLRVTQNHIQAGANPEKCFSFFKVGGGFRGEDYAEIKHRTEGKWIEWDQKNPPTEYIELAGGVGRQLEKPDMWIRPKDSVVVSVKAASVGPSDSFALGFTLRFPRFRSLRLDRSWDTALSIEEFQELKQRVDEEAREKAMTVEDRKRRNPKRVKRELVIAGEDAAPVDFEGDKTQLFEGLEFCVLSESLKPYKKTKTQLEAIVKENGGSISQRAVPSSDMIIIADKKVVKVASLIKGGDVDIIRPNWIRDCLDQESASVPLPYEERHLFHATDALRAAAAQNADAYGDSYARNVSVDELRDILADMPKIEDGGPFNRFEFLEQLEEHGHGLSELRGFMFQRCSVYFHCADEVNQLRVSKLAHYVKYAGGACKGDLQDKTLTHVVVMGEDPMETGEAAESVRNELSSRRKMPRVPLLTNRQEQPVTHVAQAGLQHALRRQLPVHAGDPQVGALGPLAGDVADAVLGAEHGQDEDPPRAPLAEGLDGGGAGAAGGDDGVDDDGEAAPAAGGRRGALGEVVVVLDGVQGGGLTVDAEVVDGDAARENGLHAYVLTGCFVYLLPVHGGGDAGQRFHGEDQGNLVHQVLDMPGAARSRAQLAQLGAEARMLGDVNVGREGRHGL